MNSFEIPKVQGTLMIMLAASGRLFYFFGTQSRQRRGWKKSLNFYAEAALTTGSLANKIVQS